MSSAERAVAPHGWPDLPLTSPVCPSCGRKEQPRVVRDEGNTEHVVYECRGCNRRWTVRHRGPDDVGTPSTRRH